MERGRKRSQQQEVFEDHVVFVQGLSPSERSGSTRSQRNYLSGRSRFNVWFGRLCTKPKVKITGFNLPLYWLYKKRRRISWWECSNSVTTSRFTGNVPQSWLKISVCGIVYMVSLLCLLFLTVLPFLTCLENYQNRIKFHPRVNIISKNYSIRDRRDTTSDSHKQYCPQAMSIVLKKLSNQF